jgi:hypothetical protein
MEALLEPAILEGSITAMTRDGFTFQFTEDRELRIGVSDEALPYVKRILKPGIRVLINGLIGTDRIIARTIQVLWSSEPAAVTDFAGYCIEGGHVKIPRRVRNLRF